MNYTELSQKIKKKYPGSYDDMDDMSLAKKIISKYPQYSDVTFDNATSTPEPSYGQIMTQAADRSGYSTSPSGLLQNGFGMLQEGAGKLGEMTAEKLATRGPGFFNNPYAKPQPLNPIASAAVGTAVAMTPDIIAATNTPIEPKPQTPLFNKPSNVLERMGAPGINRSMGIKPSTIEYMAGKENPADYGTRLARSSMEEGATGLTKRSMFNKAMGVKEKFGQKIGDIMGKFKQGNVPTSMPAEEALNPLVEEWSKLGDSALTANQRAAKPFEQIYGKLVEKAKSQGGQLVLDDLREAMDEVGSALERAGEGTPLETAYSKLYGKLAQARSALVERIASQSGDPQIANELRAANEGYTRYSRLTPDIRQATAKSTVSSHGFHPFDFAKNEVQPFLSKGLMKAGGVARDIAEPTEGLKIGALKGALPETSRPLPKPGVSSFLDKADKYVEEKKPLKRDMARQFWEKSGHDKIKARKMALDAGYIW